LEEMVSKLKKPRRVMMLVKAGEAVDKFIDALVRTKLFASFLVSLVDQSGESSLI